MPELPEVEVTRRSIDEPLRGAVVTGVRLGKPLRWPLGCEATRLVGRHIGAVQRRAKYLWLPLFLQGSPDGGLLIHLGMSGSLSLRPIDEAAGPHDHVDLLTDRGMLRLTDPRRFGAVIWSPALDAPPAADRLAGLGLEPFDEALDERRFHAGLKARRSPIKAVLLSGDVVVGAGNIYACEALFQAGIHPARPASRIGPARAGRLLAAVRDTLGRALQVGGTTLRDFRDAHGHNGAFQEQTAVYGREGQPCPRCAQPVRRIVQAQRSTFYCPHCQRH